MGEAARLVDAIAHRHAGGRWLATGGGGYDVYRVVPRAWALTWLAGAHREIPASTPSAWRDRWAADAARYGQAPLPETFEDAPDVGRVVDVARPERRRGRTDVGDGRARAARRGAAIGPRGGRSRVVGPAGGAAVADPMPHAPRPTPNHVTVLDTVDRAIWSGLTLEPRVAGPADPALGHAIIAAALDDGALLTAAVQETTVVGLVLVDRPGGDLLAFGVAPDWRRTGLARDLLAVERARPDGSAARVEISMAERDVVRATGPVAPGIGGPSDP